MLKKKNVIMILVLVVLIVSFMVAKIFTTDNFMDGVVTGYLGTSAAIWDDRDTWFVRVNHPGIMVLTLESLEPEGTFQVDLNVLDTNGKANIEYRHSTLDAKVLYVNVFESEMMQPDPTKPKFMDFKVNVKAKVGRGQYKLTVLKPSENISEQVFGNSAYFQISIKEGMSSEDIKLTWEKILKDFSNFAVVKVRVWDKTDKKEVFATKDESNTYYFDSAPLIKIPELPVGNYTVGLQMQTAYPESWKINFQDREEINSFTDKFYRTIVEKKQTQHYRIKLNPGSLKEKYLWVTWNRSLIDGDHTSLEVELTKDDTQVPYKVLMANNLYVFPLLGLSNGEYDLKISCATKVNCSIGIEREESYHPIDIVNLWTEFTLDSGTLGFSNNGATEFTFINSGKETVEVVIGLSNKVETLKIGPGEYTYLLPANCTELWIAILGDQSPLTLKYEGRIIQMDHFEPNNNFASAKPMGQKSLVRGNISGQSDVDYFEITVESNSIVKLNLLQIPEGTDYNLELYNSENVKLGESVRNGNQSEELSVLLQPGVYYAKVYSAQGFSGTYYELKKDTKPYVESKWFTQYLKKADWTVKKLDKLYFTKCSAPNEPIYTQFIQGCIMCSVAMILRNLGVEYTKYEHFDFRTGNTGYLEVDPFVFMMAFHNWPEIKEEEYVDDKGVQQVKWVNDTYELPNRLVYCNWRENKDNMVREFGYDIMMVSLRDEDLAKKVELPDDQAEARKLLNKQRAIEITTALEKHPEGVIVTAKNQDKGVHSMVYIRSDIDLEKVDEVEKEKTENDGSIYSIWDNYFTVCDPATGVKEKGDNINFSVCYSRNKQKNKVGGIPSVSSLIYFEKK